MFKLNGRGWRSELLPILSIAALSTVLLLLFPFDSGYSTQRDPLGWALWSTWTTQTPDAQDYAYCILVPIIVVCLVLERKSRLALIPIRGSNAALLWIILGLFIFWVGSRAGKQYVGCLAIQILLAGFILWFWGGPMFRQLLFAWAFLVFAWPLPFLDSTIAFPLRLIVSHLAFHALNLIGIPCIQSGTALNSAPNPVAGWQFGDRFQIDITDPCSGLHSLLPLLMFSACYSYFFIPLRWQQWTVFLSAIPFAIIANVVRILLLVFGCLLWGNAFALGTNEDPSRYHEACGYVVYLVALGLENLLGFLLIATQSRFFPSGKKVGAGLKTEDPAAALSHSGSSGEKARWRSAIIFLLAALMAMISWNQPGPYLSPEAGVLTTLPNEIKSSVAPGKYFFATDTPVTSVERRILPKDTIFARKIYDDFQDHNILFSIVLSGLQQYNIHPPQVCLVAQGWSIIHEENIGIPLASGRELTVRNLTIQREANTSEKKHFFLRAYYMYWYVTDGISTPSSSRRNWLSSWDRVIHNRDHRWAYVIAMSPITDSIRPDGLNAEQTRTMLVDFIREIVPTFQKSEMPNPDRG